VKAISTAAKAKISLLAQCRKHRVFSRYEFREAPRTDREDSDGPRTTAGTPDLISKDRDEFAVFFFQARRSFRYRIEHDTKSSKHLETSVMASYKEAMNRGFKGSLEQWRHLQLGP
jgi:hypothetical protein